MLNPFPDLLVYGFFAPTLLRILVAVAFAGIAFAHIQRRDELPPAIVWPAIVLEVLVALSLFFGYYTQVGALAGAALALAHGIFAKSHPRATPLCRGEYILIFVICLSLLISGAGALAFDLPL